MVARSRDHKRKGVKCRYNTSVTACFPRRKTGLIGYSGAPRSVACVIGIIFGIFMIANSIIIIAMFSYSSNGASVSCDNFDGTASCSARTAALGILAGCLGFTIGITVAIFFGAALCITILSSHALISAISTCIIVFLCLTCAAACIIGWALMADDIHTFRDEVNCNSPGGWNAAVAFAVIGTVFWCVVAVLTVIWFSLRFCFSHPEGETSSVTVG